MSDHDVPTAFGAYRDANGVLWEFVPNGAWIRCSSGQVIPVGPMQRSFLQDLAALPMERLMTESEFKAGPTAFAGLFSMVEQQRIANLIAFVNTWDSTKLPEIRRQVEQGLGLS